MSVANQTRSIERVYNVGISSEGTSVDFNDQQQVAACLAANGTYVGYELDSNFSEDDVMALALQDAHDIINQRQAIFNARRPLQLAQLATIKATQNRKVWEQTHYVVTRTPVDQSA